MFQFHVCHVCVHCIKYFVSFLSQLFLVLSFYIYQDCTWLKSVQTICLLVYYTRAFCIICFNIFILSVFPYSFWINFGTHQLFFLHILFVCYLYLIVLCIYNLKALFMWNCHICISVIFFIYSHIQFCGCFFLNPI
jgi:hypothetical protein